MLCGALSHGFLFPILSDFGRFGLPLGQVTQGKASASQTPPCTWLPLGHLVICSDPLHSLEPG